MGRQTLHEFLVEHGHSVSALMGRQTLLGKFIRGVVLHGGTAFPSNLKRKTHFLFFPTMEGYKIKDKTLTSLKKMEGFILEVNS